MTHTKIDPRDQGALRAAVVRALAPQGIGMGVAFDWAITVELMAIAVGRWTELINARGLAPAQNDARFHEVFALILVSALPFALGEGLRRGYRWAWLIQLAANAVGSIGGLLLIPGTVKALSQSDVWPLIPTLVLVILSPLIVWRLSRPTTRAWVARGNRAEALRRHGGLWLLQTCAPCSVGGILVALAFLNG